MQLRVLLVIVALAGCKKSKEDSCEELAKLGIAVADELGKQLGGKSGKSMGDDPEIKDKMREFKAQCMTWPDEVFECMRNGDEDSPKCKEAMQHVTGVVSADAAKAPAGPPIVASAKLGEPSWDGLPVSLSADGTLVAAPKDGVVSVDATGAQRWRVELDHGGWMLAMPDVVLVGERTEHAVVALERATGEVKWRIAVPAVEEYGERSTEGAVQIGAHVYVAIADGRFLRVDPAACAKPKQKGCIQTAFTLTDETFDNPALRVLGNDLVIGESNAIRRISTTGEVKAWIHVRDDFGGFALEGEKLAAVMDEELVMFDLGQCPTTPVALSRKKGRMYIRGEGDCEDCSSPPAGCLLARSELSDVDSLAPQYLRDGSIAISNMDGPGRVAPNGNKHWVSEVDSVGPMREVGDNVVFVSRDDDGKPARVVALSTKTGKAAWMRTLSIPSSEINSTDDPIVEVAGPWLVAGAKGAVSWIKVQ
jgi:outer membrane protein assembly factor BamB